MPSISRIRFTPFCVYTRDGSAPDKAEILAKWKEMLQNSKFNETGDFPIAYKLLLNMGGDKHEGYVGFQDHGDDVWYRNVRIKIRD